MNPNFLDFEQPIAELEDKLRELTAASHDNAINMDDEVGKLRSKLRSKTAEIFRDLSPWQITQLSRHPGRPYTSDYIAVICDEFHELAGDRMYADDRRDRGRPGARGRTPGDGHRPPEGPRHQVQGAPQLRHAASGGLPQGAAPDEDGRTLRPARAHLHRHARRLPRRRRRGARPERSDRAQPRWKWPD